MSIFKPDLPQLGNMQGYRGKSNPCTVISATGARTTHPAHLVPIHLATIDNTQMSGWITEQCLFSRQWKVCPDCPAAPSGSSCIWLPHRGIPSWPLAPRYRSLFGHLPNEGSLSPPVNSVRSSVLKQVGRTVGYFESGFSC